MPTDEALLAAVGISRRGDGGRLLLDDVELEVAAGDRVSISGPSGSGKSQLLRALALLDPFDSGEVLWQGSSVADADVPGFRGHVSYHQQTPALVEGSVEDNLRLPFSLAVHSGQSYECSRAEELLERFGRDPGMLDQVVADLSGGERQIVTLVRLLQLGPQILLLDEPTAALDPETERWVIAVISDWVEAEPRRRAYLWITHDERLGPRVAERHLEVLAGKVRERSAGE